MDNFDVVLLVYVVAIVVTIIRTSFFQSSILERIESTLKEINDKIPSL